MAKVRGHGRVALVLLCTAVFLDSMDLSLMGVALPSVQRELSLSEGTLQWLVSGYAVAYGGFLLLGGRLADLLGRRRMFVLSLTVFAMASLAGGLFSDGALLVVTGVAGVVAVILLVAFVFIERRHRNPLVPLAVFGVRTVRAANTAALAWACATIGWQFAAVLYLQQILHYDALASGLVTSAVQIGAGVGVAVLATLLTTPGLTGYRLAFLAAGCFSVIGALVAALGIRATISTRQPAPTQS